MANALVTSTIITNEVLRIAHNTSAFLGNMNTDFDKSWKGQCRRFTLKLVDGTTHVADFKFK